VNPYAALDSPAARAAPVAALDRLQFEIGRWVDEGSLRYEAWRIGRTPAGRIRERAQRYRHALDHLEQRRLIDEPARLFDAPVDLPAVERKPARFWGLPAGESIRFASRMPFTFPESFGTAVRDGNGRNAKARAYLWRSGHGGRPALICIHGYRAGFPPLDARAFGVATLSHGAGFDVALAVLPFHGARTPHGSWSGQLFLNDPLRTIEAVAQAVLDLRRLALWLRAQGAPSVGVVGMSLGGYMTALLASIEPDLDFALPVIPVASFADILWHRAGIRGEHDDARAAGISLNLLRRLFSPHCPLTHPPLVARDRRLIVAGEADRIVPPTHAAALAAHWQAPIEWFPGGHLAQLARGRAFARFIAKVRRTVPNAASAGSQRVSADQGC
jgi:pimeloyl-ACP methyl ester carboxylesterase